MLRKHIYTFLDILMKRLLSTLVFLMFVASIAFATVLMPSSLAQERDLTVEKVDNPGANTFVLLIGINKYPADIPSLEYCVSDTEGLAASLKKVGVPADRIIVMVDDAKNVVLRPSRANIERQIELITDLVTENDQLVVAFSGHGAQIEGEAYLCPNDVDLDKRESFLPRKWVYERLENSVARKKLFITDACRNEITVKGAKSIVGAKSLGDPLGDVESYGFALLASCSKNQKSYEDDTFKHGVFTYFVMKGLEGAADTDKDGRVTFGELYTYVLSNTRQHVLTTRQRAQVPMRGGEFSGDFVLTVSAPTNSTGTPAVQQATTPPPVIPSQGTQPTEPKPSMQTTPDGGIVNYKLNLAQVALGELPPGWNGPNNAEVNNVGGTRCLTNNTRGTLATLTITDHFNQPGDFVLNITYITSITGIIVDDNGNSLPFELGARTMYFVDFPNKGGGAPTSMPPGYIGTATITRRGNILSMTGTASKGQEITRRSDTFKTLTGISITIPHQAGVSAFSVRSLDGTETVSGSGTQNINTNAEIETEHNNERYRLFERYGGRVNHDGRVSIRGTDGRTHIYNDLDALLRSGIAPSEYQRAELERQRATETEDVETEVELLYSKIKKEIGISKNNPRNGPSEIVLPDWGPASDNRPKIVRANPELNVLFKKGNEAATQKRYSDAKRYYEQVLKMYSELSKKESGFKPY